MISRNHSDWLKIIALLTMVIDHVGAVLFPDVQLLRMIGRLSFPLFAFQLAVGIKYTKDLKKYQIRLFLFACISQIPYVLALDSYDLNIMFTFLVAMMFITNGKWYRWAWLAISFVIPIDYGWYGVLTVVLFYYLMDKTIKSGVLFTMITISFAFLYSWTQIFAVLSLFFIRGKSLPDVAVQLPRNLFYWFYPIHLFILWLITL